MLRSRRNTNIVGTTDQIGQKVFSPMPEQLVECLKNMLLSKASIIFDHKGVRDKHTEDTKTVENLQKFRE